MLGAVARAAPWVAAASLHGDTAPMAPERAKEVVDIQRANYQGQHLDGAEAALAAASNVVALRAKQDELLTKIQESSTEFSDGYDAASAALSQQLLEVEAELDRAETEAAGLQSALAAVGVTDVSPNINSASIDQALAKVRALRETLRLTGNIHSTGGESPVKGPRAKGGPVSRGGVYLVGEEGPELMTASKSGYIHPNGSGVSGGSGSGSSGAKGGVQIGSVQMNISPNLTFPNASAADADAIAKTVMGQLKEEMGAALRGVMADVSMGY
jgi:hypothetical protein